MKADEQPRAGSVMGRLRRVRHTLGRWRAAFRLIRLLRHAARVSQTPEEVIAAAREGREDVWIWPSQVPSEIAALLEVVRAERPRRVLEIGTWRGGTLYLLTWASSADARILSLDIEDHDRVYSRLFKSFGHGGKRVVSWTADSHLESTRVAVADFFDGPIDVLFIDGDHSAAGVRRDYELYAPLVRPGGLIAFHDIVDSAPDRVGAVPAFWREVRTQLDDPTELVESWQQAGWGIGFGRAR